MATSANPNIATGAEPTDDNRASVTVFNGVPSIPGGRKSAQITSATLQKKRNLPGKHYRRAPMRPQSV